MSTTNLSLWPTALRRFGLRSLLLTVAALALILALQAIKAQRQRDATEAFAAIGGTVVYEHQRPAGAHILAQDPNAIAPASPWIRRLVGDHFFMTPVGLVLNARDVTDEMLNKHLPALPKLEALAVQSPNVTDSAMPAIANLNSLSHLWLNCPQLTSKGLSELRSGTLREVTSLRDNANLRLLNTLAISSPITKMTAVPLREYIAALAGSADVNFRIEDSVSGTVDKVIITAELKNLTLAEQLGAILSPHRLGFRVSQGEIVLTTIEEATAAWLGLATLERTLPTLSTVTIDW